MRVWPGKPYPLGATWDGNGVNFALFSESATKVELCLFDGVDASQEAQRLEFTERTDQVWHAYLPDALPGNSTGIAFTDRTSQPRTSLQSEQGRARSLCQGDRPGAALGGRSVRLPDRRSGADLSFDERDNAPFAPLAVVIDPAFTWGDDRPPRTPWHKTIIYEVHVKGFTKLHPGVAETLRGTYAGLASEAAIKHLLKLGVTAVELMPVHHLVDDRHLVERRQG